MPVSCHFRGCKAPLSRTVSGAISSELHLYLFTAINRHREMTYKYRLFMQRTRHMQQWRQRCIISCMQNESSLRTISWQGFKLFMPPRKPCCHRLMYQWVPTTKKHFQFRFRFTGPPCQSHSRSHALPQKVSQTELPGLFDRNFYSLEAINRTAHWIMLKDWKLRIANKFIHILWFTAENRSRIIPH